jgi:Dyp-type peroxidase family
MSTIDLSNLQGNILCGYAFAVARYLFLRIEDPLRARQWLQEFSGHVTNGEPWQNKPASTVNIAFTHAGLRAMQLPESSLASFAPEFKQGMAQRAALLGDTEESSPEHWDGPLGTQDVHVLILFNTLSPAALDERRRWFDEMLTRLGGLKVVYEQAGGVLPSGAEHFGFMDGFSQPSIADALQKACPGQGTPQPDGSWKDLQLGEFVLGYPDEEGLLPDAPQPDALGRNGTYLVFRKLHEHVVRFRTFLREQAKGYAGDEELLAAKLVGRWRDGTPLVLSPDRMDPDLVKDNGRNNDFRYGDDPDGYKCPFSAHIRRANPREDGLGKIANRHRIIRRGVTYGPELPPGAEEDGQDRGVIFIALNSSINRQFEFIQSQWINDGNIFGLGSDKDPLAGDHHGKGKMTVPGDPPYFLSPLPRFVTVKGGEYFFMPGINALQWMATGMKSPAVAARQPAQSIEGTCMNFIQEIEALAGTFAGDAKDMAMQSLATLEKHIKEQPEPLFALLREVKPILLTRGFAVVTRFEDVQEILDHPLEFNVPYAPKMKAITGDFILGLDNTPQYEHDVSALRLALKREDLERVGQIVTRVATQIVEAASGRLDVVAKFTDVVPARLIAEYVGVPGPDEATLIEWAHLLFDDIFNNVKNDAAITRMALAAGQEMRFYLDHLITQRKAAFSSGGATPDDVLGRLLQMQRVPGVGFDDAGIRNNLIGLITGWIPTVSKSTSMALDELMRRPDDLAAAEKAARADEDQHVAAAIFEAMRFNPQNPGLLRRCADDYVVAKGTNRATLIPRGTMVFAATQSAMLDGRVLDDPKAFRLDRPSYHYMHFGWGLHTCFGQYINRVQIPLMCKALFCRNNLRRAEGQAGQLAVEGNFPASMMLCFDA